jgi:hypothetical protein
MATSIGYLYHPEHGDREELYEGFRWWAFWFGPLWYAVKGLWGHAIGWLVAHLVGLPLAPIGTLVAAFCAGWFASDPAYQKLRRAGYLTADEYMRKHGRAPSSAPGKYG